ncbi:ABC transporter ATP-binding protein [candidate division KSB1 bacterium]|nr:ABC transporter ATP-binding protein [candidate division KSB1 bacterium]
MADNSNSLNVKDVHKNFGTPEHPVKVLAGVSFEMKGGEALAVTGPSGSGKSTLLHLIGTLDSPTSGKIEINNQDISSFSETELARFRNQKIGFVFQDHHLLPQYSVLENVLIPTLAFKNNGEDKGDRAAKLLEKVGLSDRITHRPAELSGGERQRVAIARAIVNQPDIIIADEPTGNLDPINTFEVVQIFKKIHDLGTTVILTTHNKGVIESVGGRVVTMDSGRIVRDENTGKYVL